MKVGILFSTSSGQKATIGQNENQAETPFTGALGSHVSYGEMGLGGRKIYANVGSPEEVIIGGQSYSVDKSGNVYKNGAFVPLKYIPSPVLDQARSAKSSVGVPSANVPKQPSVSLNIVHPSISVLFMGLLFFSHKAKSSSTLTASIRIIFISQTIRRNRRMVESPNRNPPPDLSERFFGLHRTFQHENSV